VGTGPKQEKLLLHNNKLCKEIVVHSDGIVLGNGENAKVLYFEDIDAIDNSGLRFITKKGSPHKKIVILYGHTAAAPHLIEAFTAFVMRGLTQDNINQAEITFGRTLKLNNGVFTYSFRKNPKQILRLADARRPQTETNQEEIKIRSTTSVFYNRLTVLYQYPTKTVTEKRRIFASRQGSDDAACLKARKEKLTTSLVQKDKFLLLFWWDIGITSVSNEFEGIRINNPLLVNTEILHRIVNTFGAEPVKVSSANRYRIHG